MAETTTQTTPPSLDSEVGSVNSDFTDDNPPSAENDLSKLLAEISDEGSSRPAFINGCASVDQFIGEWKITSTLGHIVSFIKCKTTKEKLARLVCIANNYQSGSTLDLFENNTTILPYIESLFVWIYSGAAKAGIAEEEDMPLLSPDAVIDQAKFGGDFNFAFDPRLAIEEQEEPARSKLAFLDSVMPLLRPLLGLAAFFACAFGFHKLLDCSWIADTSKSVVQLAATIRAKKVIKDEVESGVDELLKLIYGSFGEEYYAPSVQKIKEYNQKVQKLHSITQNYVSSTKVDAFGLLRVENITGLNRLINSYSAELASFSEYEKSAYNFAATLQACRNNIQTMIARRDGLIVASGKQEPVVLWLYGAPGVGKSYLANQMATQLGTSSYTRTSFEEYWPNYAGQTTTVWDDILQNPKSKDAAEFMTYSTCAGANVNMAAIDEKGTPFTSRFIVATSNHAYLQGHELVASVDAFNRRRTYLVHVYNPGATEYMARTGNSPPPEFFVQQPTRFFIYHSVKATAIHGAPNGDTPSFIGEVTFDELMSMAREHEKFNSEKYRQLLMATPAAEVMRLPGPISYDRRKFDCDRIFQRGAARYNIIHPPPEMVDDEGMADEVGDDEQSSIFSGDAVAQQALSVNPVKVTGKVTGKSVVLVGPPGIGKTYTVENFKQKYSAQILHVTPQFAKCPDWLNQALATSSAVLFDDVTTSADYFESYRTFLVAVHDGRALCAGVIATANNNSPLWKGDSSKMVIRRSVLISYALTVRTALRYKMSSQRSINEFIEHRMKLDKAQWSDYIEIATSVPNHARKYFQHSSLSQLPTAIALYFHGEVDSSVSIFHQSFIVPFPKHFDVYVKLDRSLDGASATDIMASVARAEVSERQPDGTLQVLSKAKTLQALLKIAPLFQTKAYGRLEDFTSIFNEEKHPALLPQHVLVLLAGYGHLGFMPVDGQMVAYAVDPTYDNAKVEFVGETLMINESPVLFTPENEFAKKTLKRAFDRNPEQDNLSLLSGDEASIMKIFLRTTSLGRFISGCISVLPLIVHGLACSALIASLVESDPPTDPIVEERRKRGPVAPRDEPEIGSEPHNTSQPSSNNVRVERRQRGPQRPADEPEIGSEPHNSSQPTSNSVRVERRQRGPARPPAEPEIDSDPCNSSASSNTGVRVEAQEVREESAAAAPYLHQRPKHKVVEVESCNEDNQLVVSESGEYGFTWQRSVFFAHEKTRGRFTVSVAPLTKHWTAVDTTTLPQYITVGRVRHQLTYKAKLIVEDHESLRAAIGETFTFDLDDETDFGSVFACSHVFGYPLDIEANKMIITRLPLIFGPDMRTRAPRRLLEFLFKNYKKTYHEIAMQEVSQEGMYDSHLYDFAQQARQYCVSLQTSGMHTVYGIRIGQNKILSVAHVKSLPCTVVIDGVEHPVKFHKKSPRHDVAIYTIQGNVQPSRNISHMFCKRADLERVLATQMTSIPSALVVPNEMATISACGADANVRRDLPLEGETVTYRASLGGFSVTGISLDGHCGSPLLLQNKQIAGKIYAIHRAGNTTVSQGALVTQEWVKQMLEDDEIEQVREEAVVPPKFEETTLQFYDVARVSPRNGLMQYGEVCKSVYTPDTTRIHRTGIILPEEYDIYEPAIMSKFDPRSDGVFDPRNDGLRRYGESHTQDLDQTEIFDAFDEIANECAGRIRASGRTVRVLTKTEAVNTPDCFEYPTANPIDRNGSSGFPWIITTEKRAKSDFLRFNEKKQKWYFNNSDSQSQKLSNKIDLIIADAARDIPHIHPFIAYVKDEPLKKRKIYDARKTRVFFSGSFEYLIAYRMYFLAAMARMQELCYTLPPKIGISSDREAWHTLAYSLLAVGSHGFATDVANFDSSVPTLFMQGALRVWNEIYLRCSPPDATLERDTLIRSVIHQATEGAYVIGGKNLYKLNQAQVSGNPGTAIENSFVIWALYYIVWKRLAKIHAPELATYRLFRKNVGLAIYGDDNICTVAPECLSWFNYNTFAKEALTLGFQITDAAKIGGEIPDFIPLTEMEFLKRGFRLEQGYYCGPLHLESIAKSLAWAHSGQSYRVEQQHVDNGFPISLSVDTIAATVANSAVELALHGKQVYDKWIDIIVREAGRLNIPFVPDRWQVAMAKKGYNVY